MFVLICSQLKSKSFFRNAILRCISYVNLTGLSFIPAGSTTPLLPVFNHLGSSWIAPTE
jgi:hypothetical protein